MRDRVDMVNRGMLFKQTHEQVANGTYFAKKYDLDFQINQLISNQKPARKREIKAQAKGSTKQ